MIVESRFVEGVEYPVISTNEAVQEAYEEMRRAGQSHNMSEMLALRQSPCIKSDTTFLHGHCNGNQFEANPELGDHYKAIAAAAGVNVQGAVYKSGLARFPGDPEAWVRDRGDVKRLCEQRGWGCEGDVTVKRQDFEPEPDIDVADDIVRDRMVQAIEANPDLAHTDQQELFEATKEKCLPDRTLEEVPVLG